MFLSVIIPAYNEEKRILKNLHSVKAYLAKQSFTYEVLIVSDGSSDKTDELVNKEIATFPGLTLLSYRENQGKGFAVKHGMVHAKGECCLFMDADGSTSIDQLDKLLPYLAQGFDVVISSRRVAGADVKLEQPGYRLLLGWIFRQIVSAIVPLGVKDSQNGFKLFSAKASEVIFPKQKIFRWAFDVEILALARLFKFKIKEVPITWVNDRESQVTFKGMIRMLWDVVVVRWNLWTGRYRN